MRTIAHLIAVLLILALAACNLPQRGAPTSFPTSAAESGQNVTESPAGQPATQPVTVTMPSATPLVATIPPPTQVPATVPPTIAPPTVTQAQASSQSGLSTPVPVIPITPLSPGMQPPVVPPAPVYQPPEPAPADNRIQFSPGTDSASVQGSLPPAGMDHWILRAQVGQTMNLDLSFASGSAVLSVYGADGSVLLTEHSGWTRWSGVLPTTQDYAIDVYNTSTRQTTYLLTVNIPPLTTPLPTVRRISFAPGATTATLPGSMAADGVDHYVIKAMAGQTMNVNLGFSSGRALLIIYGADRSPLLTDHAGLSNWSGVLPATQDYFIDVRAVSGTPVIYTISATIPPLPAPPASSGGGRIRFAPGSISAAVPGNLQAGQTDRWLLRALKGQTMTVDLTVNSGAAILIIYSADGIVLLSDHAGATHWSGVLPSTQDYNIEVRSAAASASNYLLQVTILPR